MIFTWGDGCAVLGKMESDRVLFVHTHMSGRLTVGTVLHSVAMVDLVVVGQISADCGTEPGMLGYYAVARRDEIQLSD
jgi:hypothetical protein